MTILDRYIFKKVLSTFFFVMLILIAIIVVIDLTEKVDKFARNNLGAEAITGYYLDYIPWVAGFISPIIVFIAIVYVTSRLAAHTEIIAILSSGISFRRMLVPYFLASAVLAAISFYLNGWVIPKSNRDRIDFELQYFKTRYYSDARNVHMQIQPNVYLFIQNYNNQTQVGYQFSLERFADNRLVDKLEADNIQWDSVKYKWTLHMWKRKKVDSLFQVQRAPIELLKTSGPSLDTALAIFPKDFENNDKMYDGMTIPELREHIAKLKFRGSSGVETYETEMNIRFASPFTIFVLVFMGVIVSSRKSRGGTGFQIAMGFLLAFIFILFFMLARTFAEAGSLAPVVAAWIPNVLFGSIALVMYRYVPR
jgi:lipopolysaccharide export system permease protein